MKIFTKILLLLLFAVSIKAQIQISDEYRDYESAVFPDFYLDLANYKTDKPNLTRADIFIQMPYANLQFIKIANSFKASYSVRLTIYDEDKDNILKQTTWTEKVDAVNFNEANSRSNSNYSYKSFDLEPGKYRLRCEIMDEDSREDFVKEFKMNIKDFSDDLTSSDAIFIRDKVKNGNEDLILPNVSQWVDDRDSSVQFFYYIYSSSERNIQIKYLIEEHDENVVFTNYVTETVIPGENYIEEVISNKNFSLGKHIIKIEISDMNTGEVLGNNTKTFHSTITGFPRSITDLDEAIEQMQYIASQNEIDNILEAKTYREKLNRYRTYWKVKDPSPQTTINEYFLEYYRRVDFANKNFDSYYEGWRTDMGMVYITLGPPNSITERPFAPNSKPYEVWDYYDINKRFIFVDQSGFGDYRLLNQDYGDWYRYRY